MKLRTNLIQTILQWNERVFFYTKLKAFYRKHLVNDNLTIVDVGSNKGQSIDFFLSLNPKCKIHGFEPNVELYRKLISKYSSKPQIEIYNEGVSSKSGKLLFHENIMNETSSFESLNYESKYLKRKAQILGVPVKNIIAKSYEVDVIALSTFFMNHPSIFVDVLKIDVEGHEYDCLLGLFQNKQKAYPIKFLQIENHNDDMYLHNNKDAMIQELLKANGFEEMHKIKHAFGDFYEIIYLNTRL